jgi:hypothetical protein
MRNQIRALVLSCALGIVPVAAGAQAVVPADEIPPPGANISASDARAIAEDQGLVIIRRLHFDRGLFDRDARWKVRGRDHGDKNVEMEIDANTGVILDIDR